MPEGFFVFMGTTGGNRACWAPGRRFVALRSCGFCAKVFCFSGSNEVGQTARRMVSSDVGILPLENSLPPKQIHPCGKSHRLPIHHFAPYPKQRPFNPATTCQKLADCIGKLKGRGGNGEGLFHPMEMWHPLSTSNRLALLTT